MSTALGTDTTYTSAQQSQSHTAPLLPQHSNKRCYILLHCHMWHLLPAILIMFPDTENHLEIC